MVARGLSKLLYKGLIVVCLPLLFQLIFVGTLAFLLKQADIQAVRQSNSRDIVSSCDSTFRYAYKSVEAILVYFGSRKEKDARTYLEARPLFLQTTSKLISLIKDRPEMNDRADRLKDEANRFIANLDKAKASIEQGSSSLFEGYAINQNIRLAINALGQDLESLGDQERIKFANDLDGGARERARLAFVITIGFISDILLAVMLILYFVNSTTRKLDVIVDNIVRYAANQPLHQPLAGRDEINRIDKFFHDMTEVLKEASRKERAIVEQSIDVICAIDNSGKFQAVNTASQSSWGYRPSELIASSLYRLVKNEDLSATRQAFVQAREGQCDLFENRIETKDKRTISLVWSVQWSSSEELFYCVAHDITDRKKNELLLRESEIRTRALIEHLPIGVFSVTEEGLIEVANPKAERLFLAKNSELIDLHIDSLLKDSEDKAKSLFVVLRENVSGNTMECLGLTLLADGFPARVSATRYDASLGTRILISVMDITEERKIEQLRRDFVAMVSHDLSTPLTSTRGMLELLASGSYGELPEKATLRVSQMNKNIGRLLDMVRDLLDIEKLDAGVLELEKKKENLWTIIDCAVESVSELAIRRGISISLTSFQEPVVVEVDNKRLEQVLINILSNAIKYSASGEGIEVICDVGPDYVEVVIKDNGPGVPEHLRQAIFEKYKQVDKRRSEEKTGSGLGLAICKAIITRHNGTIGVRSRQPKGSEFWFRLPT